MSSRAPIKLVALKRRLLFLHSHLITKLKPRLAQLSLFNAAFETGISFTVPLSLKENLTVCLCQVEFVRTYKSSDNVQLLPPC